MTLNINYLLFQLIHLASEQDDEVNQEEILRLISESSFETGTMRGSKTHLMRFACEYGDYLSQLRKNVSRGVLGNVEKEIKEHYADNLTLKGLSEKYYVNSAYLGQLFRIITGWIRLLIFFCIPIRRLFRWRKRLDTMIWIILSTALFR